MTPKDTMRAAVGAIAQKRELWEPGIGSIHMTAEDLIAFGVECAQSALEEGEPPQDLMALVSEYGHCRWSEGSSGATYLDRAGERRSREEAADLFKQIEECAAILAATPIAAPKEEGEPKPLSDVECWEQGKPDSIDRAMAQGSGANRSDKCKS